MNSLSRDETIALMNKLSTDDMFRALIQKDPVAGLTLLGVSEEPIANLARTSLAPAPLASKEQFNGALNTLREATTSEFLYLVWPMIRLTFGEELAKAA